MDPRTFICTELAVAIAEDLRNRLAYDAPPGLVFHSFQTPFDDCCHLLWRMEAAHGIADSGRVIKFSDHHAGEEWRYHRILIEQEVRAGVSCSQPLSENEFSRLLVGYLSLMCDYLGLPSDRDWFTSTVPFRPALDALAGCGYVGKLGERYRWAERIGPFMQIARLWTEDDRPREEMEANQCRLFFSSLTPAARDTMVARALSGNGELLFLHSFSKEFRASDWNSHFPSQSALGVGRRIFRMIREGL